MRFLKNLAYVLLFLPVPSFGQSKWATIRFDKNLSFTIPAEYKKRDTLGQQNFLAKTEFAYIQASRIPHPNAKVRNKKELIDYYISFQKLTVDQNSGDLLSDSTIEVNDLYARVFRFETTWNDSLEIQEKTIVFVDNSAYSFTYAYFKDEDQLAKTDKKIFFSGITVHDADFENQLTIKQNEKERACEFVGYILWCVIIALIILGIILFFLKKYRVVKLIVKVLSLSMLTWGTVCLLLYFINLLMGNKFNSFLTIGMICLMIGFAIRKIKLPQTK